jgi:glycosyltransferase involved in cell wall biosynthesis
MRILFVSSVSSVDGGAERSLLELARALRDRGHGVGLAVWAAGELGAAFGPLGPVWTLGAGDPASPLGGATRRFAVLRPLVDALNRLRLRFRSTDRETAWLVSVMAEWGPDVVHTNCDLSPPATAPAVRAAGVPWAAHVRDRTRSWFHPRTVAALRAADAVVVPSAYLAGRCPEGVGCAVVPNPVAGGELARHLSGEERAAIRTELAPAGVDPAGGAPSTAADPAFLVAVVGRLDEQKGALRIVEAATRLEAVGDQRIRFLLAGRGTPAFEKRLRAARVDSDAADRVRLLGHRTDVPRWLPAVDALAVPSTREAFGRMIVEGMHAGLPVVAFRDGAAPELIDHDRTGVLVPAGDAAALADALRALAADPARARRLGEAAREAARRYEPDAIAGEMATLYQRILEG